MTIPTLVSSYKEKATVSLLQKAYATFAQAFQLAEIEHGSITTWVSDANDPNTEKIILDNLKPYLKVAKECIPTSDECWTSAVSLAGVSGFLSNNISAGSGYSSFVMNNGQSVYYWGGGPGGGRITHIQLWIDLDGPHKGNSMLGKDIFGFIINYGDDGQNRSKIGTTLQIRGNELLDSSIDILKNDPQYGCSESITGQWAGLYCGGLIHRNGWKIPEDYPVKF